MSRSALTNISVILIFSCAYINTFYNAKRYFREGMKIKDEEKRLTGEARLLFEKAIEKSAKVIKNYPDSRFVDDAIFLMGRCYFEKGDYDRAIRKFEELGILFPDSKFNHEGTYYKAMAYLRTGRYSLAIKNLQAIKGKRKELAAFQLGVALMKKGSYDDAITRFKNFLVDFPNSSHLPQIYYNLGVCYGETDHLDSMVYYIDRFLTTAYTALKTDSIRIEIARKFGRHRLLEDAIRIIGETRKESLLIIKAELFIENDRFEEARSIINMIIDSDTLSTIGDAFYLRGVINEKEGRFDQALADYDSAISRSSYQAYRIDSERRRSTLKKALELKENPGDEPAKARFLLAEIYLLNLDRPDLAIENYHVVFDSFPESPYAPKALYAIGWIKENILDDSTGAMATYDTLVLSYPNSIFAREIFNERESGKKRKGR